MVELAFRQLKVDKAAVEFYRRFAASTVEEDEEKLVAQNDEEVGGCSSCSRLD